MKRPSLASFLLFSILMLGFVSPAVSGEDKEAFFFTIAPPIPKDLALGHITTIAGTGEIGYNGDEIPATEAQLTRPRRIAFDVQGNVYIADAPNARIRYVDPLGIIHTFAGTGNWGYNGDGIPATEADLINPRGVAVDIAKNFVYISEGLGNRIRKVDNYGIISTYAGTGEPTEDRYDPNYNGDEIPAVEANLSYPYGMAVDRQGNLYIADMSNHRVRMVDTEGIIHTVAGNGEPGYNGDGILATEAQLYRPGGVVVDKFGNLYIADALNDRIRKVDTEGIIHTIAGTGGKGYNGDTIPAIYATLTMPRDVAVNNSGIIFIADSGNSRVRAIDKKGIIHTVAGNGSKDYNGDNIPATESSLNIPRGVAIDINGNLYIADKFNHRIRFVLLNHPPSAVAHAPTYVAPGELVTLDGSDSSDIDGDSLNYMWRQVSGPPVNLSNAKAMICQFYVPEVQEITLLTFILVVKDRDVPNIALVHIAIVPGSG